MRELRTRRLGIRALVAVPAVALALVLSILLSPYVEADTAPIYLAAVMFSAWRGGLGAGLLATALATALRAFFFLPPVFSFHLEARGIEELVVFALASLIISSLSGAREEALAREQAARAEAEVANAVKDEFLAAVSHELRTPLTTIKTLTRILQRDDTTDEERAEFLGDISSECERQIDLVNNLLDVTRIRAGGLPMVPSRVDVVEVIRACEKIERVDASEHGHDLVVQLEPPLPEVSADHAALRRAICSIIENAIKYTPEGGTIKVSARPSGERLAIEVEDNGRGIEPRDIPRVFERFYRGGVAPGAEEIQGQGDAGVPGIGLGLYLARVLVEAMGGTIQVTSQLGEGSKFIVSLPVYKHSAVEVDEPESASTGLRSES